MVSKMLKVQFNEPIEKIKVKNINYALIEIDFKGKTSSIIAVFTRAELKRLSLEINEVVNNFDEC